MSTGEVGAQGSETRPPGGAALVGGFPFHFLTPLPLPLPGGSRRVVATVGLREYSGSNQASNKVSGGGGGRRDGVLLLIT